MSRALAVFHGRFGRATVYQLNRAFNVHAHREGHLIFHVGGTPAQIDVCDQRWLLIEDSVVAVNPWEPHNFLPTDVGNGAIFFVLYVNHEWFAPNATNSQSLRFGRTHFKRTDVLNKHIRRAAALVCGVRKKFPGYVRFLGHTRFANYFMIAIFPMQAHGLPWTWTRLIAIVLFAVPVWLVLHFGLMPVRSR